MVARSRTCAMAAPAPTVAHCEHPPHSNRHPRPRVTGTAGKYRTAATFTALDSPTLFGNAAAAGAEASTEERVLLSVATAALPASGTLVIELFYSQAN